MKSKKLVANKYRVYIDWSEDEGGYVAKVPELGGVVTSGKTYTEAATKAEEAIALHIANLEARGEEAPVAVSEQQLSGNFMIRAGPDRHRTLMIEARRMGVSMNEMVCILIDEMAAERNRPVNQLFQAVPAARAARGVGAVLHKKRI